MGGGGGEERISGSRSYCKASQHGVSREPAERASKDQPSMSIDVSGGLA